MKSIFLPGLALLLSLTSTTLAQENQEAAQPLGDDSESRTLHNLVISAELASSASTSARNAASSAHASSR